MSNEELRWRDTWRVAFGGIYAYDDAINLKFGLAWDQTPVRDSTRLPRVPDEDRVWLSLGVQWKPSKTSAVDVGYTHLFVKDSPFLDSDAVFGVRESLIIQYTTHPAGPAPEGRTMATPWHQASYDFRLAPAA